MLVRYLVQDDPKQTAQASCFIEIFCTEDHPCYIGPIALCELAAVRESHYGEIAVIIAKFLEVDRLAVSTPNVVWRALDDYRKSNVEFPDHLLARVNESVGGNATVTFDRKVSKQPAFALLK